jgi:hypothetical protein
LLYWRYSRFDREKIIEGYLIRGSSLIAVADSVRYIQTDVGFTMADP